MKRALPLGSNCRELRIFSDSIYAVTSITNWHDTWRKNNRKKRNGDAPQNIYKIMKIKQEKVSLQSADCKVSLLHVRGHSSSAGNTMANDLAQSVVKRARQRDTHATVATLMKLDCTETLNDDEECAVLGQASIDSPGTLYDSPHTEDNAMPLPLSPSTVSGDKHVRPVDNSWRQ